jgi:hypothetical protein
MYLQQEHKWTEKIKQYKQQLEDTKKLVQLSTEIAFEGIFSREPPKSYPLYLHDQWAAFRLRQLATEQPHEINQPDDFVSIYVFAEMKDQNLLCELYIYNFILPNNARWNPNPGVGDVQLRAFTSHILGLYQWKKDAEFYRRMEVDASLNVRDEYPLPHVMKEDLQRLRADAGDVVTIRQHQRFAIADFMQVSRAHSVEALLISHDIWEVLPKYLKDRNPIGYPYFGLALNQASFYANSLLRYGSRWLGLRFHFPIIWCPNRFYKATTAWDEEEERLQWLQMERALGYYNAGEFGHPTYDWGAVHAGIAEEE